MSYAVPGEVLLVADPMPSVCCKASNSAQRDT